MADQKNPLPTDMIASYNGFDFSQYAKTTAFQVKPVFDSAGRTVAYNEYTITIVDYVGDYDTARSAALHDADMDLVRDQLYVQGGDFTYTFHGLGNINIQTTQQDVRYGPKVTGFSLEAHGNVGAKLTWTVMLCLTECNQSINPKGILELCFAIRDSVDQGGYAKRVVTGHVRVAGYRSAQNVRTISDQADRLKEQIDTGVKIPIGFRRTSRDWELSEDKTELRFTLTDEQMPPNILPPGVTLANVSHEVEAGLPFVAWSGTIRAEYELTPERSRADAYPHFAALVKDRTDATNANLTGPNTVKVIPRRLRLSEPQVHGRIGAAFQLSYTYTTALGAYLKACGLWRPVPGSYATWITSVSAALGPRGHAKLMFSATDDLIVDFCANNASRLPASPATLQQTPTPGTVIQDPLAKAILPPTIPPPDETWIDYGIGITIEVIDNTVELIPLPLSPPTYNQLGKPFISPGGYNIPYQNTPLSIRQLRGKPTIRARIWGYGERAWYDVPCPEIRSIGGIAPVPANGPGDFYTAVVQPCLGVPIRIAAWCQTYLLPQVPTADIVAPDNPLVPDPVLDGAPLTMTLTASPGGPGGGVGPFGGAGGAAGGAAAGPGG